MVKQYAWFYDGMGEWEYGDYVTYTDYAELQARADAMEAALTDMVDAFDEHVSLPEASCSCHIAPPCGDCVTFSFARDALKSARIALAQHGKVK